MHPGNFKILRCNFVNSWKVSLSDPNQYYFPIEQQVLSLITEKSSVFFTPIQVKAYTNDDYNILLSFLIEAIDLLPRKIDISFEYVWRAFEQIISKTHSNKNATENLTEETLLYALDADTASCFDLLISNAPMQTWEFAAKILKENFNPAKPFSGQNGRIKRILLHDKIAERLNNFFNLLSDMNAKYFSIFDADNHRKSAAFLRKYFTGHSMIINGNNYTVTAKEKISLALNCLLYEYRNQRTHGSSMSPFRSSKATITTYMHCHYMFILAYSCLLISGFKKHNYKAKAIFHNIKINIDIFSQMYGNKVRS